MVENSSVNAGDTGGIPGSGRLPGEGRAQKAVQARPRNASFSQEQGGSTDGHSSRTV